MKVAADFLIGVDWEKTPTVELLRRHHDLKKQIYDLEGIFNEARDAATEQMRKAAADLRDIVSMRGTSETMKRVLDLADRHGQTDA